MCGAMRRASEGLAERLGDGTPMFSFSRGVAWIHRPRSLVRRVCVRVLPTPTACYNLTFGETVERPGQPAAQ